MGGSESFAEVAARKRKFHTLDGLRGVAAILVAATHFVETLGPLRVPGGYLAVDVFFVMSGFVLANAYEARLQGGLGARGFFLIRFVRLYPLYLLGAVIGIAGPAIGLALGLSGGGWTPVDFAVVLVFALLMVPRPPDAVVGGAGTTFSDTLYPLNAPAWSLFYEVAVNIVYALTLRLPQRIFLPAVMGVSAIYLIHSVGESVPMNAGWQWAQAPVALARVGYSFFLGVLMHRLHASGRLPRPRVPAALLLAGVAILLALKVPPDLRGPFDLLCILVLLPLLAWLCVCNEPKRWVWIYSALGAISYPLYAIHRPAFDFLYDFTRVALGRPMDDFAPWSGIAVLAGLVGLSWVLASVFDVRARQWLARLLGGRAPAVP